MPVLAQSGGDARRRTIAVTYPDKGRIRLVLQGTNRAPKANAGAEVKRMRGLTQIEIELDDMVPAYLLGADYTTYVMWAVTPEGQTENLGEFRLNGSRSKLRATTKFETFSLLVTAEPHFAVTKPSRLVVLENVPPKGPGVTVQTSEIFFTGDSGRFYSDTQLPELTSKEWARQPLELLGARRAVQIAELAQAEKFASRDLTASRESLAQAEAAYSSGDRANAALLGRRAIREAERARELAEERAEQARIREERRLQEATIRHTEAQLQSYLKQIDDLTSELRVSESARERAEEEAERAHDEAAEQRLLNRTLQAQNDELTTRVRDLEAKLAQTEQAREADALAAQRQIAFRNLNEMLRPLATVVPDARGFKVVLPDSLFITQKGDLKPAASSKLNPIAGVLLGQPLVEFLVEGYVDDRMTPEAANMLSDARARAVGDFLSAAGVSPNRFRATGYGTANPVASNKTLKGRVANRRVELVFLKPD
jgi:outer membrane protein OmpA-like peptidoglycan-associated protein